MAEDGDEHIVTYSVCIKHEKMNISIDRVFVFVKFPQFLAKEFSFFFILSVRVGQI